MSNPARAQGKFAHYSARDQGAPKTCVKCGESFRYGSRTLCAGCKANKKSSVGASGWCLGCGEKKRLDLGLRCKGCRGKGKRVRVTAVRRTPAERFALDAAKRGIVCKLTESEYQALIGTGSTCVYCGSDERIGVDRKDSWLGYVNDNCVSCCTQCNVSKLQLSYEEWMRVIGPARAQYGDGKVWPPSAVGSHGRFTGRRNGVRCARALVLLFSSLARFANAQMARNGPPT